MVGGMSMEICNTEQLENIGEISFFKCGSLKLAKFLYQREIVPVSSFVSSKTGKLIYKYVKSKELDKALTEWSENRGVNNGRK